MRHAAPLTALAVATRRERRVVTALAGRRIPIIRNLGVVTVQVAGRVHTGAAAPDATGRRLRVGAEPISGNGCRSAMPLRDA